MSDTEARSEAVSASRWLEGTALACAAGYGLLYLVLAYQRMRFPFALEWMEGGSVEHLRRIATGQALYVLPSIDFVPFPYPPLYYWASLPFSWLWGVDFFALRLTSVLSSLGAAAVIVAFVRRETRQWPPALVAGGLFAASFRASGGYLDVARLDSLFTLLALATLYALRFARGPAGLVAAALLGFACMMTKQTAAVVLAPLVLWCAWLDWREHGVQWRRWTRFLCFGVVLFVTSLAGTAWLEWGPERHFLLHVIGAQHSHPIRWNVVLWFLKSDVFGSLPVLVLLTAALAWFRPRGRDLSFYGAALLGIAAAVLIPRIKVSGALNNLIPLHAWLCVVGGLALVWLPGLAPRSRLRSFLWLAVIAQFVGLLYDPSRSLPAEQDRAAGERLVERLGGIEGEVLLPGHGYLAAMAGKRVYAHQMPVADFSKSGFEEANSLDDSFRAAIRERRFAAIVDTSYGFLQGYPDPGLLQRHYTPAGPSLEDPRRLAAIEGFPVRPGVLWLPRAPGGGATP